MGNDFNYNIPVVFATDDNYVPYLSVAIQSIIENCESNISIYVFHVGLNSNNVEYLKLQVESIPNINLAFVDCLKEISLLDLDSGGVKHLNSLAWLRLLIPYILKQYDKVIYLDVDLLVLKDLGELIKVELNDYLIAACRDTFIVSWDNKACVKDQLINPQNYFNTGVLLFNTLEFRNKFSKDELLNKAYSSNYFYADQDFLNLLCDGNTLLLSSQWNMLKGWLSPDSAEWLTSEYKYAQSNPFIIHFIHKPLKETVISDLSKLFLDYASRVKVPLIHSFFIEGHRSGTYIYESTIRDYMLHLINKKSEKIDLKFLMKCIYLKLKLKFSSSNNGFGNN